MRKDTTITSYDFSHITTATVLDVLEVALVKSMEDINGSVRLSKKMLSGKRRINKRVLKENKQTIIDAYGFMLFYGPTLTNVTPGCIERAILSKISMNKKELVDLIEQIDLAIKEG